MNGAELPLRTICVGLILSGVLLANGDVATAQSTEPAPIAGVTEQQPYTNQYQGTYYTSDLTEVFRLRHMEGEGQVGVGAYTNVGFTKFVWVNQGILMLDIGGRVTNDAEAGFTTGIHRRFVAGDLMFGTGVFYDLDDEFHQGSLAFELFSPNWALRTNGYLIFGDDLEGESEYETTGATNIFFQGNNILAENLLLEEEFDVAMSGADFELARNIGIPASEVFIGGYYYNGEIGDDALGAKGGVRGFITPDLSATVSVSGDDLFGTNIFGGVTWFLGAKGGLSRPNIAHRLLVPVERSEQVVINEVERSTPVAGPIVLTSDDDAIEIVHVDSNAAPGGDGTFENPFDSLPDTQEADIVYVHADSVFAGESYTLAAEQRFLGEGDGNNHFVETEELDEILLPDGNGGTTRPVIGTAPVDAIVLAADEIEVSNFIVEDAVANGIFGDGITDFDINRNIIRRSGGRGIYLNNVSGAADGEPIATGEVSGNGVSDSALQNIQIVLASDFRGEVEDNVAVFSTTSRSIEISGPFTFYGDVEGNITSNNALDGLAVDVDSFEGEISFNFAVSNGNDGMLLVFGAFDGDIESNSASLNGDNGIDLSITGDSFSDIDIESTTADLNAAEGMLLTFSGTGTSFVEVDGNNLSGNNGGVGREFLAQNEDAFGNRPEVFIELDENTSTNVLGAGPPFNFEFENEDLFSDGDMTVELGTNVGTVGLGEGVELGEVPW